MKLFLKLFTLKRVLVLSLILLLQACNSTDGSDAQPDNLRSYLQANAAEIAMQSPSAGSDLRLVDLDSSESTFVAVYEDAGIRHVISGTYHLEGNSIVIDSKKIMRKGNAPVRLNSPGRLCVDRCGDGICQANVCMGSGCPCPESASSCPSDCSP